MHRTVALPEPHIENLGVPPPSGLHPRVGRLLDLRLGSTRVQP